jgi:hypothetical protein
VVIFLAIWAVTATLLAGFLGFYCLRFGLSILSIQQKIEDSLDLLDEKYKIFTEISEKPVFFDSIEIRQVIKEIENMRDAVLLMANNLSNPEPIDLGIFKSNKEEDVRK